VQEILGNTMPIVEKFFHYFHHCYHGRKAGESFFALILIIWHVFCFFVDLKV